MKDVRRVVEEFCDFQTNMETVKRIINSGQ